MVEARNAAGRSAILLDRDGVLVEPVPDPITQTFESPLHPSDVRLVDRAVEAVAELASGGWRLFVVSNQPAAAKGTVALDELRAVHERTVELLGAAGASIESWEYCLHHPDGVVAGLARECDCRKPKAGMLERVLSAHALSRGTSWMAGDADTDVTAGREAGVRTALLEHPRTRHRRPGEGGAPDLRAPDLLELAQLLAARGEPRSPSG